MVITVGVDEVGRGCWAGPLVAGAAILLKPIPGLKDSKKLSKIQRNKLIKIINTNAIIGLGWVKAAEIDEIGLTAAVRLAMNRALSQISTPFDEIIVDGNFNFLANDRRSRAIIKADDSVPEVSAASIAAKVARDDFMIEQSVKYPDYRFESHVGYGTSLHAQLLKLHGPCVLHRLSFKPLKDIRV